MRNDSDMVEEGGVYLKKSISDLIEHGQSAVGSTLPK